MEKLLEIVTPLHKKASRNYLERMQNDKVYCMKIAKQYQKEYWDGDRKFGYGGYKYDGRWKAVAQKLIDFFDLPSHARILDVGCGKGYLLYEFKQLLPLATVMGFDVSEYAISNSKEEIRNNLFVGRAEKPYSFKDNEFDLVTCLTTLHNLQIQDLKLALQEIERVGKNKYVVVESYRNEEELFNLQCWALTCESFFSPESWVWLFNEFGYTGHYEFIYFE